MLRQPTRQGATPSIAAATSWGGAEVGGVKGVCDDLPVRVTAAQFNPNLVEEIVVPFPRPRSTCYRAKPFEKSLLDFVLTLILPKFLIFPLSFTNK